MKKNPPWLNAASLVPQYWKYPVESLPDKPVCMQCIVTEATELQLKSAGVTHLWENMAISQQKMDIRICQNYSTILFGKADPTEDEVRSVARRLQIYDDFVVTDEFGEGSFPQIDQIQTSAWFYDELKKRAVESGKKVHLFGEYGSQAVQCYTNFRHQWGDVRRPMDPYFLEILGPDIGGRLDGSAKFLRNYLNGDLRKIRGRCLCYYYAYEALDGDWVTSIPLNAMYNYNGADTECLLFLWGKSQSNGAMIDVPQRDSGTIHPDGQVTTDYPIVNPELMKILGFFGMLFCDAVYLWDDFGTGPDDQNSPVWLSPKAGTDAFMVGVQWYAQLVPVLNEAGREIVCCDYTSNGVRVAYKGNERRVSRRGKPYFYNSYFNEVAASLRGMAFVIPGTSPAFVYLNCYLGPWQSEEVVIHYEGKDYSLGCIPGTFLYVSGGNTL